MFFNYNVLFWPKLLRELWGQKWFLIKIFSLILPEFFFFFLQTMSSSYKNCSDDGRIRISVSVIRLRQCILMSTKPINTLLYSILIIMFYINQFEIWVNSNLFSKYIFKSEFSRLHYSPSLLNVGAIVFQRDENRRSGPMFHYQFI